MNGHGPEIDLRKDGPEECKGKVHMSPMSLFFLLLVIALLSAGAVALVAYLTGGWTTDAGELTAQRISTNDDDMSVARETSIFRPETESFEPFRLPNTLRPLEYRIKMQVFMPSESFSFQPERNLTYDVGLEILIACLEETNTVTLHQVDLNIDEASVQLSGALDGQFVKSETITFRKRVEMADFVFPMKMIAGEEYLLKMNVSGSIVESRQDGFYLSSYTENGAAKYIAMTDLQPANCRRVFPLFDEPQLKAVYKLTVVYPQGFHVLSNAHAIKEQSSVGDGWMETVFEQSPLMSSYLFAIAVSEFQSVEAKTNRGVKIRVWSKPESVNKLDFALRHAIKCIEFLEVYFSMTYALDKLDLIGLPDFAHGAMENWGLIALREIFVIRDPASANDVDYARTARLIAHEIAHMWFGNIVTMKWWDDLWLNEAFATYMGGVIVDPITETRFHHEDQSLVALKIALTKDALPGTHPVIVKGLARPQDVLHEFMQNSFIPYAKGSYLLRMLHKVLGEDLMRAGLSIYLRKYQFSNADHNNLWDSLTDAVAKSHNARSVNVRRFMETWTLQMNYPVIIVDADSNGAVSVRQERFKTDFSQPDPPQFQKSPFNYKWQVPLWYIHKDNETEVLEWLHPINETVILDTNLNADGWILLNSGWNGYYRVQYSEELLQKLSIQLQNDHKVIPMRNRAQLLDDAFALADAGRLNFETALELTSYLQKEEHSIVWTTAFEKFDKLDKLFMATPAYGYFLKYMRKMIDPIYQKYAWRVDLLDDGILQMSLVRDASHYACIYGHSACLRQARAYIAEIMHSCRSTDATSSSDCNRLNPILREQTYCAAVSSSDASVWEFFWEKHKLEQEPTEKRRLLHALACTQEPWLVQRLLDETTFGSEIGRNSIRNIYDWLSTTTNGRLGMWKFFQDNFAKLCEKYGQLSTAFGNVVKGSMTMTNTKGDVEQLQRFYASHPQMKPFNSIIDGRISFNQVGSAWMEKNYDTLTNWFREKSAAVGIMIQ